MSPPRPHSQTHDITSMADTLPEAGDLQAHHRELPMEADHHTITQDIHMVHHLM
jgi:hypothetical protein